MLLILNYTPPQREFRVLTKLALIFITAISVHNNNSNATKTYFEDYKFLAVRFGIFSTYSTIEGSNFGKYLLLCKPKLITMIK